MSIIKGHLDCDCNWSQMNRGAQVIFTLMKNLLTPIRELLHIIMSIFQAKYISNVELFLEFK
jgi:hypothetical protein